MNDEVNYTLWCGNLSNQVTEELLFELFLQAGPLDKVVIPTDHSTGKKKSFAFVTFKHVESIPYTMNLMNGIRLFGQQLKLQARPGSVHEQNMRNPQSSQPITPLISSPGRFDNRRQPQFHPFDNHDDRTSRYDSRSSRHDNSSNRYEDRAGGSRGYDDRSRDRSTSGSRSHGNSPARRDSRDRRDYRGDNDQRNRDMDMRRQSVLNTQQKQLQYRQVIEQQQRHLPSDNRYQPWQQNRSYQR